MDLKLQDITVPTFVWYVLPGLNFVLFVLVAPLALASPQTLTLIDSLGGAVLVLLLALGVGFVMDSLKLYQFERSYRTGTDDFMGDLGRELGVDAARMRVLIDPLRMGLAERGALGRAVAFNHSRWVMMSHSALCLRTFAVLWLLVAIVLRARDASPWYLQRLGLDGGVLGVLADLALVAVALLLARRLARLTGRQRKLSNELYLGYVRRFRPSLRRELLGEDEPVAGGGDQELGPLVAHLVTAARLKTTPRAGWLRRGIEDGESVAEHAFQLCLLAYLCAPRAGVDRDRAVALALAHDLPEAIVGDLLPDDPRRPQKAALEEAAIRELAEGLGQASLHALWSEYEAGTTPEARLVRELDKIEMALQATIYAESHPDAELAEFLESADAQVESPLGRRLLAAVRAAGEPPDGTGP